MPKVGLFKEVQYAGSESGLQTLPHVYYSLSEVRSCLLHCQSNMLGSNEAEVDLIVLLQEKSKLTDLRWH